MSISKLKAIDQAKITSDEIKAQVADAIQFYDGVPDDDLSSSETTAINKVVARAENHIKSIEDAERKRLEAEENKVKDEALAQEKKIADESAAKEKELADAKAKADEELARKDELEKKQKQKQIMENVTFAHQEYLAANPESASTTSIKQNIGFWNIVYKKLLSDPGNEKLLAEANKKSEKIKEQMIAHQATIAGAKEKAAADEAAKLEAENAAKNKAQADTEAAQKAANEATEKAATEAKVKADAEAAEKARVEAGGAYGNPALKAIFGV